MKFKSKFISLALCGGIVLGNISFSFADATKIVTIGVNNSQKCVKEATAFKRVEELTLFWFILEKY